MEARHAAPLWIGAIGLAAAAAIGAYSGAMLKVRAGELSPIIGPHLQATPARSMAAGASPSGRAVVAAIGTGSAGGVRDLGDPAS
jgi:hypothetical protein